MSLDFSMTVNDVANVFGVNPETVRRWCRTKKIKYVKLPGKKSKYRFDRRDVIDFAVKHSDGGGEDLKVSYSKTGRKD